MEPRTFALAVALSATLAAGGAVANDAFPSKPVRIVVPYAAGGGPDVSVRQFGQMLAPILGQPVVVENKVGAAGERGASRARRARQSRRLVQQHRRVLRRGQPQLEVLGGVNIARRPFGPRCG